MPLLSDPIGDLLTRMRNAQHARKTTCMAPWSKIKLQLCELLKKEGWISNVEVLGEAPMQQIEVTFIPEKLLTVTRVSKPGRRVYAGKDELRPVLQGFGMAVLTTSQGLMTDRDARAKNIGGEILCTIS